jgi:hypothetical protein
MDFNHKLSIFNKNYAEIKNMIKKIVVKNKLKILYGSGGSLNIIIINDDYVVKLIPSYINKLHKIKHNNDTLEGDIYKTLTNTYIINNKSPHIVGLYNKYILEDIKIIFPTKCLTLDQKIMMPLKKRDNTFDKLCNMKSDYTNKILEKKATILVLENCPTTISEQLEILLKKKQKINDKIINFNIYMKRIIFQILITLGKIHQDYPDFIHNDLFLRNILAIMENNFEPLDYVEYNHLGKKYYLPANGIYIKINDFGYTLNILKNNSTLEDVIKLNSNNIFEIKNQYRDVYTFLFDLYDGSLLGGLSAKYLIDVHIKNKNHHELLMKNLRKQIGLFFNYKLIDKIHKNNPGSIDDLWNISESKLLMNTINKPNEYFKLNVFNDLMKLPNNCKIVKTFLE